MQREEFWTRLQHCSRAITPHVFHSCITWICINTAQLNSPTVTLQDYLFFGTRSIKQLFQCTQSYPNVLTQIERPDKAPLFGEKSIQIVWITFENHIQKTYCSSGEYLFQIVLAKYICRHACICTWLLSNPNDKLHDTIRSNVVKI